MESKGNARSVGWAPLLFVLAVCAVAMPIAVGVVVLLDRHAAAGRERLDRANAVPDRGPYYLSARDRRLEECP